MAVAATPTPDASCASTSATALLAARDRQLIGDTTTRRDRPRLAEDVGRLDAVLVERFASDDALAEALAGVDPRERPWTMWSVENPRIARAFALEQEGSGAARCRSGAGRPPRRRRRPRGAARARAHAPARDEDRRAAADRRGLALDTDRRRARVARGARDVELLLRAANDPTMPMRRAAILALGRQGRRELLEIAEQATRRRERGKLQGAIALALEAMPMSQTRALAHDWLTSADWARRRKAAGMLATWPRTRTSRPPRRPRRELDEGLEGDVYVICSLAEALGRSGVHGPFDELLRAYEEMPYSYGRRYIVAALAASDPTFGGDVAVDCLWDCEAETRRIAASHVDRRVRLAAQRLEELKADEAHAASVRAAGPSGCAAVSGAQSRNELLQRRLRRHTAPRRIGPMFDDEPIHVNDPGDAGDPRLLAEPPAGVVIHRVPAASRRRHRRRRHTDEIRRAHLRRPRRGDVHDELRATLTEPRARDLDIDAVKAWPPASSGACRCRCSTRSSPSSADDAVAAIVITSGCNRAGR